MNEYNTVEIVVPGPMGPIGPTGATGATGDITPEAAQVLADAQEALSQVTALLPEFERNATIAKMILTGG